MLVCLDGEELFEYHLYTLGRPTTIGDNQTKQVALLSGDGIPVTKEYRFVNIGTAYNYPAGGLRSTNRIHHPARFKLRMTGVRCAKDAP